MAVLDFLEITLAKVLLLLVIGGVIYWMIKSSARSNSLKDAPPKNKPPEDMVRCVHCGVNLPRSEAVLSRGEFFCGNEHRQLHQS
ncbi:MAG: PP0621 family protein [Pseudomonadota bacterium]